VTATPRIVTVFGSSRPRAGHPEYEEARELGRQLASQGLVVCTGGYGGVMEAASRGAKQAGGRTLAVTAAFFRGRANRWVDEEVRVPTWQERLFELIRRGHGYVACRGGTGTLVELAVVWEMLNKSVMRGKPFAVLGEFWRPVIERVREVEVGHPSEWGEASEQLIHPSPSPADAAAYVAQRLAQRKSG
jgi:uncharacterized protein (TIGR00725 family)